MPEAVGSDIVIHNLICFFKKQRIIENDKKFLFNFIPDKSGSRRKSDLVISCLLYCFYTDDDYIHQIVL